MALTPDDRHESLRSPRRRRRRGFDEDTAENLSGDQ